MTFASDCGPVSPALACSARIRRTSSDRNSRSGDSSATSRSPLFEPADRGDFGVTFAAGEQRRRRIDHIRIDPEYLSGCIHHHADRAIAQRHHHDLAARSANAVGRHPEQRAKRHQRQQSVPQRDDAKHGGFRPGQRADMVRQRNDLPHAVERKRIFLLTEIEAQQRNQRVDRRRSRATHRDRRPALRARRGYAKPGELPAQKPRRIQQFDRALAFRALDGAIQQRRIGRTCAGIVVFDLVRGKLPAGGRSDRRQSRPRRLRA